MTLLMRELAEVIFNCGSMMLQLNKAKKCFSLQAQAAKPLET